MPTCPHCGYESEVAAEACPLCGTELGSRGPGRAAGSVSAGEEGPRERGQGPPWERADATFPGDLLLAWKESLFDPAGFFGSLRPDRRLWRALLYYLLFSVVGSAFGLVWNLAMGFGGTEVLGAQWGMGRSQLALLGFLVAPFAALFGLLLSTIVFHLMAVLLVPDHRRMGETVRVLCYAQSGPQLFQAVPWIGSLVALVWSLTLMVVGIREVHGTSTPRAAGVVLIPIFLVTVALGFMFAALVATLGSEGPAIPLP